jgi:hypothetical protein
MDAASAWSRHHDGHLPKADARYLSWRTRFPALGDIGVGGYPLRAEARFLM